jgi:hypothetical protein
MKQETRTLAVYWTGPYVDVVCSVCAGKRPFLRPAKDRFGNDERTVGGDECGVCGWTTKFGVRPLRD